MDQEELVDGISNLFKKLSKNDGELSLVMIEPIDFFGRRSDLNLTVSAPWLNKKTPKNAIKYISENLKKELSDTNFSKIMNISIIHTEDQHVKNMNNTYHITLEDKPTNVGYVDSSHNVRMSLCFISQKLL